MPQQASYIMDLTRKDANVRDFYRFFEASGVAHCGGGNGPIPENSASALVDRVERGVTPDYLPSATADGKQRRNLCPRPLVLSYTGGNFTKESILRMRQLLDFKTRGHSLIK